MIINLCGPPASGKTCLAKIYIKDHPQFEHLSIDNFRREHDEEEAWNELINQARRRSFCIIETSGLSWRLNSQVFSHPGLKDRKIVTVILHGDSRDFQERLRTRDKAPVPFKYKGLSLEGLINKCAVDLPQKYPEANYIITDNTKTIDEEYEEFKEAVETAKKRRREQMSKVFTDVNVFPLKTPAGSLLANGNLMVAGVVKINFTIIKGPKGVFASLPQRKGKKKDGSPGYFAEVGIPDKDLYFEFQEVAVGGFRKKMDDQEKAGEENQSTYDDDLPF